MDRTRSLGPLPGRRRRLLVVALVALLSALVQIPARAQGQGVALSDDGWVKQQLNQSSSPRQFSFSVDPPDDKSTATISLLVVTPKADDKLSVELTASGGGPGLCSVPGGSRNLFAISCKLSEGSYSLQVSTQRSGALTAYVYYSSSGGMPGIVIDDPKSVTVSPGNIAAFRFNPSSASGRIEVAYHEGKPQMPVILFDKNGAIVNVAPETTRAFAVRDGSKPYYLVINNANNDPAGTRFTLKAR